MCCGYVFAVFGVCLRRSFVLMFSCSNVGCFIFLFGVGVCGLLIVFDVVYFVRVVFKLCVYCLFCG